MILEVLLKDKNLLAIKDSIARKLSYLDLDDIESAYYYSVWRASEDFNDELSKFSTYFYSIFKKECDTLIRQFNKQHRVYEKVCVESNFDECVFDLSDDERNLLTQHYLEQKSLREISEESNISHELVRLKIQECLKNMRDE